MVIDEQLKWDKHSEPLKISFVNSLNFNRLLNRLPCIMILNNNDTVFLFF